MQRVAAEPLDVLRTRTSAKWRSFPPDVLPLPIAEMDYPLAEPIAHALHAAVDRSAMIDSVCAAHAHDGRAYNAGLGFYTGRRFHVDSSSFRKWGANGRGATSPCVSHA